MTAQAQANSYTDFLLEPVTFAVSQPGQVLISSASVAIVALEAGTLVPWPWNIALAIGAEWVYLRGLISGSATKSRWAGALNLSAVFLVAAFGALWGFRQFGLIAEHPSVPAAVLLTLIHIGSISAVTLCSAMLHRAGETVRADEQRQAVAIEDARNRRNQDIEDARNQEWRRAQLELEIEKQRQRAILEVEAERNRQRLALAAERNRQRSATTQAVAAQPDRNQLILYNGVAYPSIQAAADAHGISRQAMAKRLKKEALI